VLVTAPEADVEAPAGEHVESRDLLGDDEGMVQGNDDHGGADAQPRRLRRDVGRELERAREVAVGREVMLRQPHVAESEGLRRLRLLDAARVNLLRGARGGRLHQQKGSNVHDCSSLYRSKDCSVTRFSQAFAAPAASAASARLPA